MSASEKQPLLQSDNLTPHGPRLSQLEDDVHRAQRAYLREWSRSTAGRLHRIIMAGTSLLMLLVMFGSLAIIGNDYASGRHEDRLHSGKVPLEAHIMSKCPDARDCLHDMILPAMQKISDRVDFTLSYIGSITDHDDGVTCMHGPTECLGNVFELCAASIYPDPKIYLGFTMCVTRDYQDIPSRSLMEDCALEHGMSFTELQKCAVDEDGGMAVERLQASFNRTKAAGVTKSCTVRLDGEVRCVRDGGRWYDCEGGSEVEDLVRDVRKLTEEKVRKRGWWHVKPHSRLWY